MAYINIKIIDLLRDAAALSQLKTASKLGTVKSLWMSHSNIQVLTA